MQQIFILAVLLGFVGVLHGVPVLSEPLFTTQENFDLTKFLGKWHDVAVASTCPWVQRHKADAAIGTLELQTGSTDGKISMKKKMKRHGTCKEISGEYQLTNTPGRFTYHVAKWGADIDAYVVHTNYNEYAIILMSKQKTGGEKTMSAKLYSRTMEVRATILDDFKRLVKEQGMADDTIIIKQSKGDCIPGVETVAAEPQPDVTRTKRNVVLTEAAPEEGSGMMTETTMTFNAEACKAVPDGGPCFGMMQRYYYNSTSMSCQLFTYGGCSGNQNNFITERQCLQSCRTEASCRLPLDAQPCTGQPKIWAFDQKSGLCLEYKEGFCQNNSNKFYSKRECDEYCGVMREGEGEFLKAN
ncbi:hypothetical protein UPYG_G00286510 [Umbra pygmaea]|uniref:Protein AMBP n=1 Tax=Umbra pygmaea TaxID=75934 RepID=A0ABD0WJZ4_UMBPY